MVEEQELVEAMVIAQTEDRQTTDITIDVHLTEDHQTADIPIDAHLMTDDHEEGGKLCQEATEQVPEEWGLEQAGGLGLVDWA